jgi:hypothetical protein
MPTYYFNAESKGLDEIHCYRCGKFTIYRNLYHNINEIFEDKQRIAILSGWIRNNQMPIIKENFNQLLSLKLLDIEERSNNLLLYIHNSNPSIGKIISYETNKLSPIIDIFENMKTHAFENVNLNLAKQLLPLLSISWSKDFGEIDYILFNYLRDKRNFIETVSRRNFIITPDGISHINSLKSKSESSSADDKKKGSSKKINKEDKMNHDVSDHFNYTSTNIWKLLEAEYGVTKRQFGISINFVRNPFKKNIIFRDIEQAYILASKGFSKPSVILAGGVIEELLHLYLCSKNIPIPNNTFDIYIKTCEQHGLLKKSISRLSDSVRHFFLVPKFLLGNGIVQKLCFCYLFSFPNSYLACLP